MQEIQVQFLSQEDSLEKMEKETATHSSTLAWEVPWMDRGAWQATVHGVASVGYDSATTIVCLGL